jgi:hypothetical protein
MQGNILWLKANALWLDQAKERLLFFMRLPLFTKLKINSVIWNYLNILKVFYIENRNYSKQESGYRAGACLAAIHH